MTAGNARQHTRLVLGDFVEECQVTLHADDDQRQIFFGVELSEVVIRLAEESL